MAKIEIRVGIVASGRALRNGWKFTYRSNSSYVHADSGDIVLPHGAGEQTLVFVLDTPKIAWGPGADDALPVSFDPGRRGNGHDVLAIWRDGDPEKHHPSSAFSYPALALEARGGDRVSTTCYNRVSGSYRYCLAFALKLPRGQVLRIDNDPRIKNDA